LIEYEVGRARQHYTEAAPGIGMLAPGSQACIRAAYRLYGGILDEIVRAGYEVLAGRVRVSVPRRLAVAAACVLTPPSRPTPPSRLSTPSRLTTPGHPATPGHPRPANTAGTADAAGATLG
jgi:phytoene synthase